MGTKLIGLGHFVPENKITNTYFTDVLGLETSEEWIKDRTGIETRYFTDPNTSSADIGSLAAKNCIKNASIQAKDIDLILVATSTPDHIAFPSTACIIQEKLGCHNTPAFDISAACSGFSFALSTGHAFINSNMYKTILVIGVDCLSKITNMNDRTTCILFADAAGAAILQKSDTNYLLYSKMYSDGSLGDILSVPKGGSKDPITNEIIEQSQHTIQMNGRAVFKIAIQKIIPAIEKGLNAINLSTKNIDYLICHQANQRILDNIATQLNLSPKKIISNVNKYGNTSAASIPLAMSEHHTSSPFKPGDIIVLAGFGAGFTWGVNIIKWK